MLGVCLSNVFIIGHLVASGCELSSRLLCVFRLLRFGCLFNNDLFMLSEAQFFSSLNYPSAKQGPLDGSCWDIRAGGYGTISKPLDSDLFNVKSFSISARVGFNSLQLRLTDTFTSPACGSCGSPRVPFNLACSGTPEFSFQYSCICR